MGERQKRAGSIQPSDSPEFMRPQEDGALSLRGSIKKEAEALYVPHGSDLAKLSPKERFLHETVERYNIVNAFLNTFKGKSDARSFAEYLIIKLLPSVDTQNLAELDNLMAYVAKAVGKTHDLSNVANFAQNQNKYKPINDYLGSLEGSKVHDFAAFLAPKLLTDSLEETEIKQVVAFLKQHVAVPGAN